MERETKKLAAKPLDLTYQDYELRSKSIKNYCISNYVVYDLIGVGSYGSVYKGMNDDTKQQVAVKVIDMRQIQNEKNPIVKAIQLRLAQSQPQLMYMCDSPYLLKCYDLFENEDLKILIIEYCNGKTLQSQIQEKKRIPQNQAWIILRQIINGLMVLHSYKIVHRDLKAENIMSHNGTYKIIDFGFSKKLQISQENSEVRNTSLGTITTMAPQVMGRNPYGLKADIWSLGVIFFQMIYGAYPYDSATAAQMYREIQHKKLFDKEEPFTFNKFTPSKEAYQFLKFTIVVETDQRPDWKAVADYPNIKNVRDEDLSQRFLKKCEVVYDERLDCDLEIKEESNLIKCLQSPQKEEEKGQSPKQQKEQEEQKKQKESIADKSKPDLGERWKRVVEEIKVQNQASYKKKAAKIPQQFEVLQEEQKEKNKVEEQTAKKQQRKNKFNLQEIMKAEKEQQQQKLEQQQLEIDQKEKKTQPKLRKLNTEEIRLKEKEVNQEEDEQYEWVQNAHLECLKTEFVFRQIFNPLEISTANKTQDRSFIEFFYLLAARCFNNMSPIQDEIQSRAQRGKNRQLVQNLKQQVEPLYRQVLGKFQQMSAKLTQSEDKVKSRLFDFFSRNINKQSYQRKDKFMAGIEKLEYSKEEQIDFTFSYYEQYIKGTLDSISNIKSTIKRLQNYRKLMKVQLITLRQYRKNYDQYKEMILNGEQ